MNNPNLNFSTFQDRPGPWKPEKGPNYNTVWDKPFPTNSKPNNLIENWYQTTTLGGKSPLTSGLIGAGVGAGLGALAPLLINTVKLENPTKDYKRLAKLWMILGGLGLGGASYGLSRALTLPKQAQYNEYNTGIVPVNDSLRLLEQDPYLSDWQKVQGMEFWINANKGKPVGLISSSDIARAAIGAGLGYGAAKLTGQVLGAAFGLSDATKSRLNQLGILGGLMVNTGVIK